jgi:hypothetical protein
MAVSEDEVEVMIGSLDQAPTELRPEYELWIGRRESWLNALPSAAQFDKDRVGPESEPLREARTPAGPQPDSASLAERDPPV